MIPILYGSQTGTGKHFCEIIRSRLNFPSFILPIDHFNYLKINNFPLVIFVCSTHGDGQCPFNMHSFYNMILQDLPPIFNFNFAILGLGDSSYEKYNFCAKIMSNKLVKLGSSNLLKDFSDTQDSKGPYEGLWRFIQKLTAIIKDFSINQNFYQFKDLEISKKSIKNSNFKIESLNRDVTSQSLSSIIITTPKYLNSDLLESNDCLNEIDRSKDRDFADFFIQDYLISENLIKAPKKNLARIISNNLITPEDYERRIYELILDIPEYNGFYPGDVIGILPTNNPDALKLLNYENYELEYIKNNIDLYSCPFQDHFKDFSTFTRNKEYQDKLLEIHSDFDLYYEYVKVPRRNILEVIEDFKLKIPFEFMRKYNKLCPRYYSFSQIDGKYNIIYNEIKYKTELKKPRLGLCSEYLKDLQGELLVEIIPSRLYFEDSKLLFFCTGTGVTLPRSVVCYEKFNNKEIKIFYGFRFHNKDDVCIKDMKNIDINKVASRDDGCYIQDVYRKNKVKNIDEWLVFVSGNTRLNKEIKKVLFEVHGKNVNFQSETW